MSSWTNIFTIVFSALVSAMPEVVKFVPAKYQPLTAAIWAGFVTAASGLYHLQQIPSGSIEAPKIIK